jgi:prenylcysteine oxidase/farnesylcysteine lyase
MTPGTSVLLSKFYSIGAARILDRIAIRLFALVWILNVAHAKRIAVIGGGISGSFFSKYISDLDEKCTIEEIHIFEPYPVKGPTSVVDVAAPVNPEDEQRPGQGSRVSTLQLRDGTLVEIGASIVHNGNPLVLSMIQGDPDLHMTRPFDTGKDNEDPPKGGLGIFDGTENWPIPPYEGLPKWIRNLRTLVRYNIDLRRVNIVAKHAVEAFQDVAVLLNSTNADTFFQSPDEIWKKIGLYKAVHVSFAMFLEPMGISAEPSIIRRMLPFQGRFRDEFLTAINLVNYNQNVTEVNALVGLGSFAASTGELFSIRGGNYRLIPSAIKQGNEIRSKRNCQGIREISKRITTVVGSLDGFDIFSGNSSQGHYDIVVLAAPIHSSKIEFLIQSQNDPSILQAMPFGGLIETESDDIPADHEGHVLFTHQLPASARRPYTQVTTTVLSNAALKNDAVLLPGESFTPRSVLFSDAGKAALNNITAITRISQSGVYKVFSNDPLSQDARTKLFGPDHVVEYEKVWGGPFGGATPDYRGGGTSTDFLLYDGAHGLGGHTTSGALYYANALELSSLACIEVSATGAKAVAKLIAQRLGMIKVSDATATKHDEL